MLLHCLGHWIFINSFSFPEEILNDACSFFNCLVPLHLFPYIFVANSAWITVLQASKKITDAKLAKDFQAVLKEFQKAQRLAAERETAYTPFVPQAVLPSR